MKFRHYLLFAAAFILVGNACDDATDSPESGISKAEAANLGKSDDTRDYCEENGWYSDGICDDFCLEPDPDCRASFGFDEFFERFNRAELPGCGTFQLCWHDSATQECTQTKPEEGRETIDFRIVTEDTTKNAYMAMNSAENLSIEDLGEGLDRVVYTETYDKSLPPGPGQDAGFRSRYTMTIDAEGSEIKSFTIFQEDYDPRSRTWGEWFDIRLNLDNPILCE